MPEQQIKTIMVKPSWLHLLICRSMMTRRYSLRGLRGVRGLSHGQRRYVPICVIHVDFDVFSEVINDQATFCVVYVDDDVVSEVCQGQPVFCVVHVDDDIFSKVNHDQTNVLLSLRG